MMDFDKIKKGVSLILEGIGEDPKREGLVDTPERVARMCKEVFAGYGEDSREHLSRTFAAGGSDIVIEKDISFYSVCEHHIMPFYGKAHIAYIPNGRVVGLSKLARCVEVYARRLQLQEQLNEQIAEAVYRELSPEGVMVMLEAEHMCMTMRGVKKPGTKTVTVCCRGAFEGEEYKRLFFEMMNRS